LNRSWVRPGFRSLLVAGVLLLASIAVPPLAAQYQYGPGQGGTGFGKNKIQYRDFNWHIYHSPHFNVYYYDGEEGQLQKVVSFGESAYDELSRAFNYQFKTPVPLIYFATHSAFEQNNIILNFIEEGVGAFASPVRNRMVLPIDLPDAELITLIRHELTHVFQYEMLFGGSLARSLTNTPPTWFIEGMASYMGRDEKTRDKMFLRDAVVNDRLPSVRSDFGGYFAYRFGHAVFDFIEERWGKEGFIDFIVEMRNTLGSRVDRAIKRAFKMDVDDFNLEFRRWVRKKYLPQLIETGEPSDFGRIFRIKEEAVTECVSPTASPSGDLVASFSVYRDKIDVVLFDARKRTFIRNLTRGYSNRYQYLISQELSIGRRQGRDLSFSPDGNQIAVFAKREKGRSLLLLDALNGGILRIVDMEEIEQQLSPAWSPDGKKIVFSGWKNGKSDIFVLDLDSSSIVNLTNDDIYDGAPVFSPDGKSVVITSSIGSAGYSKLFRVDLDKPGQRFQLLGGDSNDGDPIYSPDGKRIYFTSDRATAPGKPAERENIYSVDVGNGELRQYTNVVTGAFMPTVLREPDGQDRVVYTGFWKGSLDLYESPTTDPLSKSTVPLLNAPAATGQIPGYEPDIQVSVDQGNREKYRGRKFFLEDAYAYAGVDSNQTYVGRVLFTFSDYLGDKRIVADLSAVDTFSNFDFAYIDLSHRLQWQVEAYDTRLFYLGFNQVSGFIQRGRTAFQQTGAIGSIIYPFSFYTRAEVGIGGEHRVLNFQDFVTDPTTGNPIPTITPSTDSFPLATAALISDSAQFAYWGPITGHRWRLDGLYAPSVGGGSGGSGTLYSNARLDLRQYVPVTLRSNLAFRAFLGYAGGLRPNPFFFGGLDTVRGADYASIVGDRAFYGNVEYRFPLIDVLATPILRFQGIRGVVFFDVGGAWFHDFQHFQFYNSKAGQLQDAIADYGWGFTLRFLGLDANIDFSRTWNFKTTNNLRTNFWIGARF